MWNFKMFKNRWDSLKVLDSIRQIFFFISFIKTTGTGAHLINRCKIPSKSSNFIIYFPINEKYDIIILFLSLDLTFKIN